MIFEGCVKSVEYYHSSITKMWTAYFIKKMSEFIWILNLRIGTKRGICGIKSDLVAKTKISRVYNNNLLVRAMRYDTGVNLDKNYC